MSATSTAADLHPRAAGWAPHTSIPSLLGPAMLLVLAGTLFAFQDENATPALLLPAVGLALHVVLLAWRGRLEATAFAWTFAAYVLTAAVTQLVNQLFYGVRFSTPDSFTFSEAGWGTLGPIGLELVHRASTGALDATLNAATYQVVLRAIHVLEPGRILWPMMATNALAGASVVAMTIALAKVVFRDAQKPVQAVAVLSASCPQYFYYCAELLRDGYAELLVVGMLLAAAHAAANPRPLQLVLSLAAILVASWLMLFVRKQFIILLPAMFGIFVFTGFMIGRRTKPRAMLLVVATLAFVAVTWASFSTISLYFTEATAFLDFYLQNAKEESAGLGYAVVSLPLPLRMLIGTVYMQIYPIPLWAFFSFDSPPAAWLISLNGLWSVLVTPAAIVGGLASFVRKTGAKVNRSALVICTLSYVTGLLIVTATTLSIRHISAFYPALVILAATPFAIGRPIDLWLTSVTRVWLVSVAGIQFAWALLKLAT